MKPTVRPSGFALIITLSLLSLIVLALLALSALVRINGQMAATSTYQMQARQNALLGLDVGLSDLQRHAGDDTRITGMAGITGLAPNAANSTRHWCGVWRNDGTFVAWLASGAVSATSAGPATVELIAAGTVGAASSTSANVEKEHVLAGKVPIIASESPGAPGVAATVGNYAYLVTDEGGKISAWSPPGLAPIPGVFPLISTGMLSNQVKLRTAIDTYAGKLPVIVSFEQLALLPAPAASLTPSVLQDTFHYATLTTRSVAGSQYLAGTINLNTASTLVWRCILETYNSVPGFPTISAAAIVSKGNAIGNGFAATTAGKAVNGPFTSVAAFNNYLATVFPLTGSPTYVQIMSAIGPLLVVRSDTFRIRSYGEALNPADVTRLEAVAQCEAVVQRSIDPAPNGLGRRFVITYFRWLSPGDI